jgi:uncharacterized membrane protein YhaH (DUF805 family)
VSFGEAISDGFSKFATFSGRSSRSAYWWWYLFGVLVLVAALILDAVLGTNGILYILVALGMLLPNLAVTVRRLHDAGHSGWWLLIALVPIAGAIVLLIFTLQGSEPPNQWGAGPDEGSAQASALA